MSDSHLDTTQLAKYDQLKAQMIEDLQRFRAEVDRMVEAGHSEPCIVVQFQRQILYDLSMDGSTRHLAMLLAYSIVEPHLSRKETARED